VSLGWASLWNVISELWYCLLGSRKAIQPVQNEVLVRCWWRFEVGTCEASRFKFESDVPIRIRFESDVRIQKFWISTHAVCRHTTDYAHSLFNKKSTFAPFVVEIYVLQLLFTCRSTAVARVHTQLPHDNRHWTCKRLPPDSVRDSIQIQIVAAYSIWDSIRTEISNSQVPNLKELAR